MASIVSPVSAPAERVALGRLLWVGPLTIVVAVIVNVIIQQLSVLLLRPDPLFMPLTLMPPIIFTIVGGLGATITYALVGRFARRPALLFQRIALVAFIILLVPDFLMLFTGFNPGTTFANVMALIVMHIATWQICVQMLTRLTVKPS